jgi:hypothetical protein
MRKPIFRPLPASGITAVCILLLGFIFTFTDPTTCNASDTAPARHTAAVPPSCIPGSCTIFTASLGERVLFGNNEDWINPNTYYWTVPAEDGHYGGLFFGFDNFWPQGGVNEKGLVYDINALPGSALNPRPGRRKVRNPCYEILKTCATVEEAVELAGRIDWGPSLSAQMHLADATGDAAVMSVGPEGELAFTRKPKGDGFLVSTNFNRANPRNGRYPCRRYDKAVAMLKKMQDQGVLSVDRFRDILDAVHQEGPLANTEYSNVFDLKAGTIYLYHWHRFDEVVELRVSEEIAKAGPPKRIQDLFSKETVEKASAEFRTYRRTIRTWKTVAWIWFALAAGSLGLMILDLVRRKPHTRRMKLAWVLCTVILGPFGLGAYWTASRNRKIPAGPSKTIAIWQQALGTSVYGVTANVLGITGAFFTIFYIQPVHEAGLGSLIARFYGFPWIAGLLAFHGLHRSSFAGRSFWKWIRRRLLFNTLFTNAALIGMFPVSCILMDFCGRKLGLYRTSDVLFWGVIAAGAFAGVLTAYPLNAWMARRGFVKWPAPKSTMAGDEPEDGSLPGPSLTNSWGVLLVSTILLVCAIVIVLILVE